MLDTWIVTYWTGAKLCRSTVQASDYGRLQGELLRLGILLQNLVSLERLPDAR